jgi:hypothetical protein
MNSFQLVSFGTGRQKQIIFQSIAIDDLFFSGLLRKQRSQQTRNYCLFHNNMPKKKMLLLLPHSQNDIPWRD